MLAVEVELHRVRECCVEEEAVEMDRRQRLLRRHRLGEHEWCHREHQELARLLRECLIRQREAEHPCYQLAEAEPMKWHA